MRRRTYLGTLAGGLSVVAGCTGDDSTEDAPTDESMDDQSMGADDTATE